MKRALIFVAMIACGSAHAAVTDWFFPTVTFEESQWSDLENVKRADDEGLSAIHERSEIADACVSAFGIDDSVIPEGATIDGLEFRFTGYGSSIPSGARQIDVTPLYSASDSACAYESATAVRITLTQGVADSVTAGGATALFGGSPTRGDIIVGTFGVYFVVVMSSTTTRSIDSIEVRVYYTEAATGRRRMF